jgi:hypothetical protein
MNIIKKTECLSLIEIEAELSIARTTLSGYLIALGIQKVRFQFDRKMYITKSDYDRLKEFMLEK